MKRKLVDFKRTNSNSRSGDFVYNHDVIASGSDTKNGYELVMYSTEEFKIFPNGMAALSYLTAKYVS